MHSKERVKAPVAFLIFNRPGQTARVFESIRAARPARLFVVADGPRNEEERVKCMDTRAVLDGIDWECEVLKNYSEINLGCGKRVSTGLSWVFENTDRAIILEDDCLPSESFFGFCDELLERYKDDERIMHIGGISYQDPDTIAGGDYYFSKYTHIWGWATWSRAWRHYDFDMKSWPEFNKSGGLDTVFASRAEKKYWSETMDKAWQKKINTWDYQWTFACWSQSGLAVIPRLNLVQNIGFGQDATHYSSLGKDSLLCRLKASEMSLETHPCILVRNVRADTRSFFLVFDGIKWVAKAYHWWWLLNAIRILLKKWNWLRCRLISALSRKSL